MVQSTFVNQSEIRLPRAFLLKMIESVRKQLVVHRILKKTDQGELTLVFLSVDEMRKLNRKWRKKNKPTDVLSFTHESNWGDLVFCPEVIQKQSLEHALSFNDEFLYMFIHGWLHLLGYDHELSKKQAQVMFQLQDQIFDELRSGV